MACRSRFCQCLDNLVTGPYQSTASSSPHFSVAIRFAIHCLDDENKTSPPLSRNLSLSIVYRDSILLLVQSGLEVALANLPGLFKPSKALLAKVCSRDQEPCRRTLEMFVA